MSNLLCSILVTFCQQYKLILYIFQIVVSNLYPLYIKFFNYLLEWKDRSVNLSGDSEAEHDKQMSDTVVSYRYEDDDVRIFTLNLLNNLPSSFGTVHYHF